jgi:hypothetical protein
VLLVILWKIRDARNAAVFRNINQNSYVTISKIVEDITLWADRCRDSVQKVHAGLWRDYLASRRL